MSKTASHKLGYPRSIYSASGPETIQLRQEARPRLLSGRTLTMAMPPSWTKDGLCWPDNAEALLDSPWDRDEMSDEDAAKLCAGCPVIGMCLAVAMEEEGDLSARNRYGIRGGLARSGRAALAAEEREVATAS